jgi:hypothetical protein
MKINNNTVKLSALVFGGLFLFTLFNFHKVKTDLKIFKEKVTVDNKLQQNQFDVILKKYDSLNSSFKSDIKIINSNIDLIPNTGKDKNFINSNQKDLNAEIKMLKSSIVQDNKKITELTNKVNSDKKSLRQLESLKLSDVKIKADKLSAININARGVKILSDMYSKSRASKIQQIRVCFTIEGNEFVKKGDKQFYIQVVNPKNQIISSESTFIELKDIKLIYSAKVDASYNQKDVDICTYVDLEKNKTIKGDYIINVYNEFSKIGTAIFNHN